MIRPFSSVFWRRSLHSCYRDFIILVFCTISANSFWSMLYYSITLPFLKFSLQMPMHANILRMPSNYQSSWQVSRIKAVLPGLLQKTLCLQGEGKEKGQEGDLSKEPFWFPLQETEHITWTWENTRWGEDSNNPL